MPELERAFVQAVTAEGTLGVSLAVSVRSSLVATIPEGQTALSMAAIFKLSICPGVLSCSVEAASDAGRRRRLQLSSFLISQPISLDDNQAISDALIPPIVNATEVATLLAVDVSTLQIGAATVDSVGVALTVQLQGAPIATDADAFNSSSVAAVLGLDATDVTVLSSIQVVTPPAPPPAVLTLPSPQPPSLPSPDLPPSSPLPFSPPAILQASPPSAHPLVSLTPLAPPSPRAVSPLSPPRPLSPQLISTPSLPPPSEPLLGQLLPIVSATGGGSALLIILVAGAAAVLMGFAAGVRFYLLNHKVSSRAPVEPSGTHTTYTPGMASRGALPQLIRLPAPGAFSEGDSTSRCNSEGSSSDLAALRQRVQNAAEKRRAGAYTPDMASRALPQPKGLPAPGAFSEGASTSRCNSV